MQSFGSMDELRQYVQQTLCERHALDAKQFPLSESLLTRGGRPCGLYFCQPGPRLMRAHAVWDSELAVLAFYDASGARFHQVRLKDGPDPRRLAA